MFLYALLLRVSLRDKGSSDSINVCGFAPEIFADKEEKRRNPGPASAAGSVSGAFRSPETDGFQDFLTQISGNF